MTNLAIEARGLRKSFGDHVVLDEIDLAVPEGSVFALIGPNGSGKTTTVWVLSAILPADDGMVRVAGHDVSKEPGSVRRAIGVTGQFSAVDNLLTGEENLLLMADLAHLSRSDGRRRAGELLERFDLVEAAGKPVQPVGGSCLPGVTPRSSADPPGSGRTSQGLSGAGPRSGLDLKSGSSSTFTGTGDG